MSEAQKISSHESGYWDTPQLCKFYGDTSSSTIKRWIKKGIIPPGVKIGGKRLHRIADHIQK